MEPFDAFVPQFRRAKERWPEASTLVSHYDLLVTSYESSACGIIASVKSFIECVCITILGEFGKSSASDVTTTLLLGEALKILGLDGGRGTSKLGKLLSAHNRMVDALNEMRNEHDPVAHGKDGFLDALTANECRAFLLTADTVLALILEAYEGTEPDLRFTREPYERFARFHDRVDQATSIDADVDADGDVETLVVKLRTATLPDGFEIRLEPSKLLYAIDREMYVQLLASALGAPQPAIQAESPLPIAVEGTPLRAATLVTATGEVVPTYEGALSSLKTALQEFLQTLGGLETAVASTGTNLRDSILATAEHRMGLDWTSREPLQAAMKVALRRTLTRFGIDSARAEQTAERLVAWFKKNAATLTEPAPAA
jgi:Abortive infection C-terminus